MLIRKWESKDNLQIEKLERECFAYPWDYEMICGTYEHPLFLGFVAEEDGEVVGYAGAIYCGEDGDIALVATSVKFRRKGIAQSVINRLIGELLEKKVENIFLEVRVSNYGARALYEKLGFKEIGIRKNYYENAEDAIVMKKVLSFGV